MTRKSRLIRILLLLLAVLLFAGYFAFSTFFFSPFEGGLGVDLAGLIGRDVDVFVARADLAKVFGDFPRLSAQDEIEAHPAYQLWSESPEHADLYTRLGVQEALGQLEEVKSQIPLGLDPLSIFGGRDLALAANLNGPRLEDADWAVYGTLNWAGKLAFEGLRYPGLVGLDAQGLAAEAQDEFVLLSGGQLQRPLYLSRIKDVGIVSTSEGLVREAHERHRGQYEDSMLLRSEYGDYIEARRQSPDGDEVEIWIRLRDLFENLRISGAWPEVDSQDFLPAFLGRYFQASLVNYVTGTLGIKNGLSLDLRAQISSELMSSLQTRAYRRKKTDQAEIRQDVASLAPADTSLLLYFREDVGDLLTAILESMEPDARRLIEEAFQQTGAYRDIQQVVHYLDACLLDRVAIVVRPNDYQEDPEGPPHDDNPVPAIALIGWIADGKGPDLESLRDTIGTNPRIFGLRGREEGDAGYYMYKAAGYDTREFWNQLIPGTGVIATANAADMLIVSNSNPMIAHIMRTFTQGAPEAPRLSERGDFQALLGSSLRAGNLLVWANPESLALSLHEQARFMAEDSIVIDWKTERRRAEERVVSESFSEHLAGWRRGQLPVEVQQQVDELVQPILVEHRRQVYDEQVPAVLADIERKIAYGEAVRAALLLASFDMRAPPAIDLSLRVLAPLEP